MLQEYLFRGIQKQEWNNLFQFISVKGLPVANLQEAERGPGGASRIMDLALDGDNIDSGTYHHSLPPKVPLLPDYLAACVPDSGVEFRV